MLVYILLRIDSVNQPTFSGLQIENVAIWFAS